MGTRKIKWGNIIIILLILAAAIYAFANSDFGKPFFDKDRFDNPVVNDKNIIDESTNIEVKTTEEGLGPLIPDMPAEGEFVMGLDSWIGGTPALMALSREYKDLVCFCKIHY